MIPRGQEAIFFGVFELSDKGHSVCIHFNVFGLVPLAGSSWIGPLAVAGLNALWAILRARCHLPRLSFCKVRERVPRRRSRHHAL